MSASWWAARRIAAYGPRFSSGLRDAVREMGVAPCRRLLIGKRMPHHEATRAAPRQATPLGIAAILAICGCAPSRTDWTKPGMATAELSRHLADRERQTTGPLPFRFKTLSQDYESAPDQIPPPAGSL